MYVCIHTYIHEEGQKHEYGHVQNGMCNASAQHATVADDALLSLPAFSAPVHLRFISHHSGSCLFSMMFRRLSVHTYRVRLVNLSTFLAVLLGHASSAPSLLCTGNSTLYSVLAVVLGTCLAWRFFRQTWGKTQHSCIPACIPQIPDASKNCLGLANSSHFFTACRLPWCSLSPVFCHAVHVGRTEKTELSKTAPV